MFIPYRTDAPIYHFPITTVCLVAANVAVFAAVATGNIGNPEEWTLWYGDGLHPSQWLSSVFLHVDLGHLIGNALFIWLFGLVIEGKLGWWKYLLCFLVIGVGESMFEQLVMLGTSDPGPGSLGASAAVYGLLAMAAIWAPLNEITFFYMIYFRPGTFDISISVLAAAYVGWEILAICLWGASAGSSFLHLAGFVIGIPLGIILLKCGIVDCEGWDLFHVWTGDYGAFKKQPDAKEVLAKADARQKTKDEHLLDDTQKQFRKFLQDGNADAAIRLYEKMKDVRGGIQPTAAEWLAMIKYLHQRKRWADSAPYLANYIATCPTEADAARIKLAQICVVELQRPGKALELLDEVNLPKLPAEQVTLVRRIQAKAKQLQLEGVVELDVDTW